MDYSDFEDLRVEVRDGIGHYQIARPERLNALRTTTFWEIVELGRRFQVDPDVRVIVCTHEGRGFCSGADLVDGSDPTSSKWRVETTETDSMGRSVVGLTMARIDKPTIASVNGVAAGAGFAFACSFDLRIVGPGTRFISAFARRALSPDAGMTYWLPRLVGQGRALELLYTSREVQAEEAVRIGLANEYAEDPDARAFELAKQLASGPPLSYMWIKREVQHSWLATPQAQTEFEWAAQKIVRHSEDAVEGRRAFVEKRQPFFLGR